MQVACMAQMMRGNKWTPPRQPDGNTEDSLYAVDLDKIYNRVKEHHNTPSNVGEIRNKKLPGVSNDGFSVQDKVKMVESLYKLAFHTMPPNYESIRKTEPKKHQEDLVQIFDCLWFFPELNVRGITIRMVQKLMLTDDLMRKEELPGDDVLQILAKPDVTTTLEKKKVETTMTEEEETMIDEVFDDVENDTPVNRNLVLTRLRNECLLDIALSGRALSPRQWLLRGIN